MAKKSQKPLKGAMSLTNQATAAEACLEFLRLENLHAPWQEMEALFDRARFSIDESGARIGWDVVEITSASPELFDEVLATFAAQSARVAARESLTLHYLAAVLSVGGTAENEAAAAHLEAHAREGAGRYGLRLHIGFMVGNRYVDRVLAWA